MSRRFPRCCAATPISVRRRSARFRRSPRGWDMCRIRCSRRWRPTVRDGQHRRSETPWPVSGWGPKSSLTDPDMAVPETFPFERFSVVAIEDCILQRRSFIASGITGPAMWCWRLNGVLTQHAYMGVKAVDMVVAMINRGEACFRIRVKGFRAGPVPAGLCRGAWLKRRPILPGLSPPPLPTVSRFPDARPPHWWFRRCRRSNHIIRRF